MFLSADVDINYASSVGNFKSKTALMWASSQGRLETISLLLEADANINDVDVDGVSALMWACGSEAPEHASYKHGLMVTPNKGHYEVVKKLLQYGAIIDLKDKDGITAIMYASFHGHSRAVEALLNNGADASLRNRAGKTALQLTMNAGFTDTAEIIKSGPTIMVSYR